MNIRIKCSKCNTIINFQLDEAIGVKHVACPQCGLQYRAQTIENEPTPYVGVDYKIDNLTLEKQ